MNKSKAFFVGTFIWCVYILSMGGGASGEDDHSLAIEDALNNLEKQQETASPLNEQDMNAVNSDPQQPEPMTSDIAPPLYDGNLPSSNIVGTDGVAPDSGTREESVGREGGSASQVLPVNTPIMMDVLELKNMDIQDVLKLIAKKSGLNIIADHNIKGQITIYLKEIEVRDALRIILGLNEMAFVEEDNMITVMPAKDFELQYGRRFDTTIHPKTVAAQQIIDVLELKDMDIIDVLKLIAKKSDLNIVAGQNVRGKVTIYLKKVDVRDALRIILETNNLAYFEENGIIQVMADRDFESQHGYKFGEKIQTRIIPLTNAVATDVVAILNQVKSVFGKVIADETSNAVILVDAPNKVSSMQTLVKQMDVPRTTEVFALSYAGAEEMSKKLSEVLTKNVGRLDFDSRSNKVIITDTPRKMEEIKKIVAAFDQKEPEVLIEAKIVQIVLSDEYKLGIDWEAIVSDYKALALKGEFSILDSTEKRGKLSLGTLTDDDYHVLLEALKTVGTTNILSSPRIAVLNNQEAKILVGSTEPYVTSTTTTPSSGPTTTAESVQFIDVGVKLYVTATIHNDGYITMKIKPEVSSVTKTISTSTNNTIPVKESSEAETMVRVKDQTTIVIGGLIKNEKIDKIKKVPLLGDLPLVGFVFRNQSKLERKTELVIFLTPRIITGGEEATQMPLSDLANDIEEGNQD